MKIYAIKGREGEPGYLKQSMKLPKSWGSKPLLEVLQLFCNTYNKKNADAPISPEDHHFERPLGSTLFPDDHVDAALSDYCDVHVVPGAVKYRGPPPGTAAAAEAAEAEQRKKEEEEAARRSAEEDAKLAAEGKLKDQWRLKVRCVALDRGGMDVKSQYKVGDAVAVTIEPHATVGMLSNRIGLMVGAHPKHQFIYHPREGAGSGGPALDPLAKLKDVTSEKVVLELVIKMPSTVKEIPVLSDDEGCLGVEDAEPPAAAAEGECSDWEKQAALKAEAEELRMAGDAAGALAKLDEALAMGGASALLLCKRADLLLKAGRPKAAELDCEAALAKNPDSAKAYKLRGKARRKLGEYETAAADFGQAQRIDFDDGILDDLKYCSTRAAKIRAIALAEEHNA
eukprot:CAMPEP_0119274916 /NCGR_PEP_ID=MMETSP1329-20130426/12926_1 /TAXON_ID=114041 /ORGANISM="Genus nov. species nov., Strain RCC1024" /LENGTH=397 /DNA_ID=CAMNT_0007275267 /DNA_START=149 /DNA_END=1339 /DNA_ORIENTATION=-